jgi:hypothetical protein
MVKIVHHQYTVFECAQRRLQVAVSEFLMPPSVNDRVEEYSLFFALAALNVSKIALSFSASPNQVGALPKP